MRLLTLFSICLFLSNCSGKKPIQNEIVVEVPGIINKSGISGLKLKNYPKEF